MKWQQVYDRPRTLVLVFDMGDEAVQELLDFAKRENVASASMSAIGAFESCTLGYFDWQKREYEKLPVSEQVELLSLVGNLARDDKGEPKLHAHVVVGRRDGSTRGGHLVEARVRPTLELTLVESPEHLRRSFDPKLNLALLRPDEGRWRT